MPRINKQEYGFLKNLDDKWKWIARNRDGGLYKFQETPEKIDSFRWNDRKQTWLGIYGNLFQFIQWEDKEPYNIQELIKEYEIEGYKKSAKIGWNEIRSHEERKRKESEEKEMKKGKEWLKEEIWKQDTVMDKGYIYTDDLMSIIKELDEPEVKELERKIKELESYNDELIRDNNQLRNELDNQEVLSPDWIDEHSNGPSRSQYVWVNDLKELLVPKQEITEEQVTEYLRGRSMTAVDSALVYRENLDNKIVNKKPAIPKFVAEWIEENKRQNRSLVFAIKHIYDEIQIGKSPDFFIWMESDDNEEVFARAWLDGFTVEEEPLYRARLKVITDEFIASYLRTQSSSSNIEDRLTSLEIGNKFIHEDYRHLSEFTEDELKRLDIWDSEQWEVEELEE